MENPSISMSSVVRACLRQPSWTGVFFAIPAWAKSLSSARSSFASSAFMLANSSSFTEATKSLFWAYMSALMSAIKVMMQSMSAPRAIAAAKEGRMGGDSGAQCRGPLEQGHRPATGSPPMLLFALLWRRCSR